MTDLCLCLPDCPARCTPNRLCDDPECSCYQFWVIEFENFAATEALA